MSDRTFLRATDATGQRIVDGLRLIRPQLTGTDLRLADSALLATSRPGSAAVADMARDCAAHEVPLVVVSLSPAELRVGPVFSPGGECFRCHRTTSDLDGYYDEHPHTAPDGHLPQHIALAVRIAVSMLDQLAEAHGAIPASLRRARSIQLLDNALSTAPGPIGPCPHNPRSDSER